jgi:Metallopeptidase family M24
MTALFAPGVRAVERLKMASSLFLITSLHLAAQLLSARLDSERRWHKTRSQSEPADAQPFALAQEAMFRACREALRECQAVLRAGRTVGDVFVVHSRTLTRAGYKGQFLNACGYTMGATYPPTWTDEPMIYAKRIEKVPIR